MSGEAVYSLRVLVEGWAFEFVWEDILRNILLEVLANGQPAWPAIGWSSEAALLESVERELNAENAANVARGLKQEHAEMIVSMVDGMVVCEAVEDRAGAEAAATARRLLRPPAPRPRRTQMDVERGQLLCSALGPILRKHPQELQPDVLTVKYHGEAATDGAGGAGVTRAFLTQAGALLRDVRSGLLIPGLQSHQQLSPCPGFLAPRAKDGVARQPDRWSRFLGRLLGMSVAHECPLGLTLVPSLCKQLVGQEPSFEDIRLLPGMEPYYNLYRKWLAHRNTALIAPEPSLVRLTTKQVDDELECLPAQMPSKTQLVFTALLLRIEEAAPSESEWEEGLDAAACLLRQAKTSEQHKLVLDGAHKILLRMLPDRVANSIGDDRLLEDEAQIDDSSTTASKDDSTDTEQPDLPDGLPRALQALHAALPDENKIKSQMTCHSVKSVRKLLDYLLHAYDVVLEVLAPEGETVVLPPHLRLPEKKRGGGARRAVRAKARAAAYRARILDLEATPADWHYSHGGHFTLSIQGSECIFSELNEFGIISGMLTRNSSNEPWEGNLYKTQNGERVVYCMAKVRVVLDDTNDYCISNFKNASEAPWGPDVKATRVPLPPLPNLSRVTSKPTEADDLSRDNLLDVAKATAMKALAGNLPYLSEVAAEFQSVVPEELFLRLSRPLDFEVPFSEDWSSVLDRKLDAFVEEDKPFFLVTDGDGIAVDSFFCTATSTEDWTCPRCTMVNAIAEPKCAACNGPRPKPPGRYKTVESTRFPLRLQFEGWRRVQSLVSGFHVDISVWKSKTVYRASSEEDAIVQLWWEYVEGCAGRSYEELRKLFQWSTGWASAPTTNWKFQIRVLDDPAQLQPGKERLPTMILCMTDDASAANRGVKTPTLNLPKYADRWVMQTDDGWLPFEPGVEFVAGEDFQCAFGQVKFTSAEEGILEGPAPTEESADDARQSKALRLVSAKFTLSQKMWWAVYGGQNMDAI